LAGHSPMLLSGDSKCCFCVPKIKNNVVFKI